MHPSHNFFRTTSKTKKFLILFKFKNYKSKQLSKEVQFYSCMINEKIKENDSEKQISAAESLQETISISTYSIKQNRLHF